MTDIAYGAVEYADSKQLPFRTEVEKHTLFSLLGDVSRKRIIDVGCGDGIYSRQLIDLGAAHVIGVDGADDFIELAVSKNKGYENKIEYHQALIQNFHGSGDRDLAIGSYVLSYPRTLDEAVAYCKSIVACLKKGGRFIGFNNNPFEVFDDVRHAEYGCEKEMHGDTEGREIIYRVSGMGNEIINFYLKPRTYEQAFEKAGFSQFKWQRVLLNPSNPQGEDYWKDFFTDEPPFIAMIAEK